MPLKKQKAPVDQLIGALEGMGLAGSTGSSGLAGLTGVGGMMVDPNDFSSYWGEHEGTGIDISGTGTGTTPVGLPEIYDPPMDTPTDIPPIYDPPQPIVEYDTPRELPPIYDPPPPPTPTSPPVDIDTYSYTPPATPGQIPQFSMPNFAFNFPMPDINPLMGGPNMGPVGFYSVNSGAAGLPVPAYSGIENPNMLSNYVQQFVGGPNVLSRSLIG